MKSLVFEWSTTSEPCVMDAIVAALRAHGPLLAERDALRARAEAAEAALATARAEGAAAEREAVVAFLRGGADTHAGIGSPAAAAVLRNHAAYIAAGAHVRHVEGA
jgi:hypothetical protein